MKTKIYTNYEDFADSLAIYIVDESLYDAQQGPRRIWRFVAGNDIELQDIVEGGKIEPTLRLDGRYMVEPFLQAMADMTAEHGIKPQGKPILENELTATKYHLEDMRALIFKEVSPCQKK